MFLDLDLNTWWFLVFGAVITGYAILDGFDLGAGMLHLFLKKEESRRIALNAIGPVWDGNEVWLVIGGGALFAGFPIAYAAIFSGFYLPVMIFLIGLIWRAVAIEFRSKEKGKFWRLSWDIIYSVACFIVTIALGLMLGNVAMGLPLNEEQEYAGNLLTFLNPFSVMVAISTIALFMMHGAIYLAMKTERRLLTKVSLLARNANAFFLTSFSITSLYTLLYVPHLTDKIRQNPPLFIIPLVMFISIANIPLQLKKGHFRFAFISSSITIASLLTSIAVEIFPNLLIASNDPALNITIQNAASSTKTMETLLIIAAIGTPLVGLYTGFIFWTFKGKVRMDETSL